MRARLRWIAIGLIGVLAVAAYPGLSFVAYDRLTAAAPRCDGRFGDYTPASFGTNGISAQFTMGGFDTTPYAMPGYREVDIPSRDRHLPTLTIRAWWVPAAAAAAPAVILVHGFNSCRHDPVALLPAGMLARNGFSVLMIDLRDQGDSDIEDGRIAWGAEEYLDVLGAWDWLRTTRQLPASRIGLMGESLGAASAIIAMGEEPAIPATWADSSFADASILFDEVIARSGFPSWLRPGAVLWCRILSGDDLTSRSPLDAVGKIGARQLAIVHGLADDQVPVHHASDLAAAHARFVPGFEAWLVPRALHVQAAFAEPAEYERRITAFFRAGLGT